MSETTNTEAAPNPDEATEQQQDSTTPPAETLGEGGVKALKAERDARKALEAQLKEYQDRDKTELQRAQDAATEAQSQLAQIQAQNLRNEVALSKGLNVELVQFLTANTADELGAQADLLLSKLGASPATPKPDPSQGATGSSGPKNNADLFANFVNSQLGG